MALNNFIPEVWSDRLKLHLDKSLVYGNVVNREYQSELISYGDTVNINRVEAVTIGDYTKNTNMTAPETLTDSTLQLIIDAAKFFNFQIDDIDKAQQKPKVLDASIARAAYGLGDAMDQYIAALFDAGVAAGNRIGTDGSPITDGNAANLYGYFTQAAQLLNEASVPMFGRYVVLPPWMYKELQDSTQFTSASNLGDAVKVSGSIGQIAGFDVLMSNNVPNTTSTLYKVVFGISEAVTFADQINSVEAYRPELRFADGVKGLHVYGGKVVHDDAYVVMTANPV